MNSQVAIIQIARRWVGTPYLHQASRRGNGCDCLGLVIGVRAQLLGDMPVRIPPYSSNWRDRTHEHALLEIANHYLTKDRDVCLDPGRIAIFKMARGYPLKHCGIIVDPAHFIHAQERTGVTEAALSAWWKHRIVSTYQFREYAG